MDKSAPSTAPIGSWLEVVREQVTALRFGHVQVTVHNSEVVQVETTARIRFNQPPRDSETEAH